MAKSALYSAPGHHSAACLSELAPVSHLSERLRISDVVKGEVARRALAPCRALDARVEPKPDHDPDRDPDQHEEMQQTNTLLPDTHARPRLQPGPLPYTILCFAHRLSQSFARAGGENDFIHLEDEDDGDGRADDELHRHSRQDENNTDIQQTEPGREFGKDTEHKKGETEEDVGFDLVVECEVSPPSSSSRFAVQTNASRQELSITGMFWNMRVTYTPTAQICIVAGTLQK
eukprot:CAMPEP_0196737484 /NCGR_PEP_ID=MMETSP1091-20130531/15201_1 /TAXON_ID=302021 /ORGANISM="Rhodomonas sp., Strain CCMP768" /LENGTH=231 /DNA_ID=CAMNT_0042081339 /DNA_START=24 /DNA_END=720 /DNA_ORIENTATION=-